MSLSSQSDRDLQRGLARAIARSWRDPEFADRLQADPRSALADIGVAVPAGVRIDVVPEGTLVLPLPTPDEPSDDVAEAAARDALEAWGQHLAGNAASS